MTTPSPQPQPDGDFLTEYPTGHTIGMSILQNHIDRVIGGMDSDLSLVRLAREIDSELDKRIAPAPAPTANIRRAALDDAANYIRTHYVGLDDRGIAYEVKPMEKSQTQNSSRETHPVLADAMLKALGDL
jgi:hypothetical protein